MLSISLRFLIIFSASLIGVSFGQSNLPYKGYSGFRLNPKSKRLIFHHEQTIALVEFLPRKEFANCELIEVLDKNVKIDALNNLTKTTGKEPKEISFKQMMDLMNACAHLPDQKFELQSRHRESSPLILEGTNWCGAGDVAINYYDLGKDSIVDKCCRTHDLCPKKVRSRSTDYGVENNSAFVTMSHCDCDSRFLNCLKNSKNTVADLMGTIYFNLLRPRCLAGDGIILKAVENKNNY